MPHDTTLTSISLGPRTGHRKILVTHKDLKRKIEAMEKRYDEQFRIVFEAITQLLEVDEKPKKKICYIKEGQAKYGKIGRKN